MIRNLFFRRRQLTFCLLLPLVLLSGVAGSAAMGGSGGNSGGGGWQWIFLPRPGSGTNWEVGLTSSKVLSTRSLHMGEKGNNLTGAQD